MSLDIDVLYRALVSMPCITRTIPPLRVPNPASFSGVEFPFEWTETS